MLSTLSALAGTQLDGFCGFPLDYISSSNPFDEPREICNAAAQSVDVCRTETFFSGYQCRWENGKCTSDADATGEDPTCPLILQEEDCEAKTWFGSRSCKWYEFTAAPSQAPSPAPSASPEFCGFPLDFLEDNVDPFAEPRVYCNNVAGSESDCGSSLFFGEYQCRWEDRRCTSDADETGEDETCPSIRNPTKCREATWSGPRSCVWYSPTTSPTQEPSAAPSASPEFCGFPLDFLEEGGDPFLEPREYCNSLAKTEGDCGAAEFFGEYQCRWEDRRCTSDADETGEDETCPSIRNPTKCREATWAGARSCVWYAPTASPSEAPSSAPSVSPEFCGFPLDFLEEGEDPFLEPREYCNSFATSESDCGAAEFFGEYQCRWEDRRCTSDADETGEDETCPSIRNPTKCREAKWAGVRSCVWYSPTSPPSEAPSSAPTASPEFCGFPQDFLGEAQDPYIEPRQYCDSLAESESDCGETSFFGEYQCRWEDRRCTSDADETGEDETCPFIRNPTKCREATWAGSRSCVWYGPTPSLSPSISTGPSVEPSAIPSHEPSFSSFPSLSPSVGPSSLPSVEPSLEPSNSLSPSRYGPTALPSSSPSADWTSEPSGQPSVVPTDAPTVIPTVDSTGKPTTRPTRNPTTKPSKNPTLSPTARPSNELTDSPTLHPALGPTSFPSVNPTVGEHSAAPTELVTSTPTDLPTMEPTPAPTHQVTSPPSGFPTKLPTPQPSLRPTANPTPPPSVTPTLPPTARPTRRPSSLPTPFPTPSPTLPIPPTARPTERFAPGERLVSACQCDTAGRTCVSASVEEGSSVFLCLNTEHDDVEFVDVQDLQFYQDGNIKDEPINNYDRSSQTFVSVEGRYVLIRTELLDSFYTTTYAEEAPSDVQANGIAILAIRDGQGGRNLQEVNLRLLQSGNGDFNIEFSLQAMERSGGTGGGSNSDSDDGSKVWTWTGLFVILGVAVAGLIMLAVLKRARNHLAARVANREATEARAAATASQIPQQGGQPYMIPGGQMMIPGGPLIAAPMAVQTTPPPAPAEPPKRKGLFSRG